MKIKYFAGIDEAGRGPIAGPVSVAVAVWPADMDMTLLSEIGVRDSKKLTAKRRREIYDWAIGERQSDRLSFAGILVPETMIDKKGIVFAIRHGLAVCLERLKLNPAEVAIRLDGSLFAPPEYKNQETIIGGDGKDLLIGLASVIAKVGRDEYMIKISDQYPEYDFAKHKGYGTRAHYEAIKENGLCPIHRRSFLKGIDAEKASGTMGN